MNKGIYIGIGAVVIAVAVYGFSTMSKQAAVEQRTAFERELEESAAGLTVEESEEFEGAMVFEGELPTPDPEPASTTASSEAPVAAVPAVVPAPEQKPVAAVDVAVDTEPVAYAGSYEVYAPEKIARAESGDVVIFFHAAWCPTCRTVDANIKANLDQIPDGLSILNINYDTAGELKKKYGVTYQHTFVQVDAEGTLIHKWQGGSTLASVVAQVK